MVREDRKNKKSTHIKNDIHKLLDHLKTERGFKSIEESLDYIAYNGFERLKEKNEIPGWIINKFDRVKEKREGKKEISDKEDIELSDLDPKIIELSDKIEGTKAGKKDTIKDVLLHNLRYLISHSKASKSDFIKNVYPDLKEDHTKESYWKVSQTGFKQLADLTDKLKTPSRGHSKYTWEG